MDNLYELQALCMDLKRTAIGYHRGSTTMGQKFADEALRRKKNINILLLPLYLQKCIARIDEILLQDDPLLIAEDALMYSTIIQNYCIHSAQLVQ